MINNRQAGRRRGRGGQQQRPQGNSGARDTGNRIDNRSRGNAAQLLEKYKALARDAQMSGDRVNTEYYLQFADHYFRVLAETRSRFEENRAPMQGGANTFQDDEQDYNDEGEPVARAEQPRQQDGQDRQDGRQNGNQRQDRQQADRPQYDRQQGDRQQGDRPQNDRPQNDRPQNDRSQNDRQKSYQGERQNGNRDGSQQPERAGGARAERAQYDEDRPRRQNGNGGNGGDDQSADRYVRDDRGRARADRYQNEDRAAQPQEAAAEEAPRAEAPRVDDEQQSEAPRRRGRPRREPAAEAPPAFEADRLPPSLNISAVTPASDPAPANDAANEGEEKPRRRRGRPPASEAPVA